MSRFCGYVCPHTGWVNNLWVCWAWPVSQRWGSWLAGTKPWIQYGPRRWRLQPGGDLPWWQEFNFSLSVSSFYPSSLTYFGTLGMETHFIFVLELKAQASLTPSIPPSKLQSLTLKCGLEIVIKGHLKQNEKCAEHTFFFLLLILLMFSEHCPADEALRFLKYIYF